MTSYDTKVKRGSYADYRLEFPEGEPVDVGFNPQWRCPCGADMHYASSQDIFGGEISHLTWCCETGHVWTRYQVGWDRWEWERRA